MGIQKINQKQIYKTYNQITKEFDVFVNKYNDKYYIELIKKKMAACVKHKNTKSKKSKMTLDKLAAVVLQTRDDQKKTQTALDKLAAVVLQIQKDIKRIVKLNNLKY